MNKQRRRNIEKVINIIEAAVSDLQDLLMEEQDAYDNIPENLQESERAYESEEAIETMEEVVDTIEESLDAIKDALEEIENAADSLSEII